MSLKKVAVIKGVGTGPEFTAATPSILKAASAKAEFIFCDTGFEWGDSKGLFLIVSDNSDP